MEVGSMRLVLSIILLGKVEMEPFVSSLSTAHVYCIDIITLHIIKLNLYSFILLLLWLPLRNYCR